MMALEKRFLYSLIAFRIVAIFPFLAVRECVIGIESVIRAINCVPERTFIS